MRAISTRRSPSPPGSPWPVAARSRSGRSSSWRTCRRISHEKIRLVTQSDTHDAIDAVWRIESARLIAGLTRITGDVGLAEDLAQDALVAALERWPESGVPDNPGAWLMATAKRRAIDGFRRGRLLDRKHQELGPELLTRQEHPEADLAAALDDHIGDDRLGLIFTTCIPCSRPKRAWR